MAEIDLGKDEVIVAKQEKVIKRLGFLNKEKGDLILTNQRLVWKVKYYSGRYPQFDVKDIKVYDNKAQAKADYIKEKACLIIYFQQGEEMFEFEYLDDAEDFANEINHVVTETHEDIYPPEQPPENKGFILSAIGGVADTISSAIYRNKCKHMKPVTLVPPLIGSQTATAHQPPPKPKKVSKKCIGCHAPLSGREGDEVICSYCNFKQVL